MQYPMVDIGFCSLYMYMPVVILYQSLGLVHGHVYTSDLELIITTSESSCAWDLPVHGGLICVHLNCIRVISGQMFTTAILKMSESVLYRVECALT